MSYICSFCDEVLESVSKLGAHVLHRHKAKPKPILVLTLCQCGCGNLVSRPKNKFIQGHNNRGQKFSKEHITKLRQPHRRSNKSLVKSCELLTLCQCGCNESVDKIGNKFILGHYARIQPQKYGKDNSCYGKPRSPETRLKISKSLTGRTGWSKGLTKETDKRILKISEARLGKPRSPEMIAKMSAKLKGRSHPQSQATRNKIGATRKRLNIILPIKARDSISATVTGLWKTSGYVSKQMRARKVKPNRLESRFQIFLNKEFPNKWKYVGDGRDKEFIVGGKCPDFANIINKVQILELFGDFWHQGQDPQIKIDHYKNYGIDCLVIWERELKDITTLKEKIACFMEEECPVC